MKKIVVCGHFFNDRPAFDGQTIKTVNLYKELTKKYGDESVVKIDTYFLKKNPFAFFLKFIKMTRNVSDVVMLPAQRGVKLFPKLFNIINRKHRFKIHYVVIGAWLPSLIQNNSAVRKELMKINYIYVETTKTIRQLENMGFSNVRQMNNFKDLSISDKDYSRDSNFLKCCIFSRIEKQKGIDDAIEVINRLNSNNEKKVYLDIYGKIKNDYIEHFNSIIKDNNYISYCGTIDSDKSVSTLEKYDLLLFPTLYYTEGIPGTIIDAFFSGVPVLSSRWENFNDVIQDDCNGIGYNFSNKLDFEKKLLNILNGKYDLTKMSKACKESASNYLPQNSLDILFKNINNS